MTQQCPKSFLEFLKKHELLPLYIFHFLYLTYSSWYYGLKVLMLVMNDDGMFINQYKERFSTLIYIAASVSFFFFHYEITKGFQ